MIFRNKEKRKRRPTNEGAVVRFAMINDHDCSNLKAICHCDYTLDVMTRAFFVV